MADFLAGISLFPLVLTLGSYQIGLWCQKKTGSPICNPLLIATLLSMGVLLLTGFDLQLYQAGNAGISWLLTPSTVCLAVPLYDQLKIFKKDLGAILIGVAAGTAASLGSIALLCALFRLDGILTASLLPKSVTTAIGMSLSEELGGIPAITVAAIVVTGIGGNCSAVFLCKLFHITDPVAKGIAIGTTSHAIGTAKALEMGEVEGAMSGLSIAVCGLMTVLCAQVFAGLL